jgi:enterochelin esterase-like enzyme
MTASPNEHAGRIREPVLISIEDANPPQYARGGTCYDEAVTKRARIPCVILLIAAVAVCGQLASGQSNDTPATDIRSARIAELRDAVNAGDVQAEQRFWTSVQNHAPLQEPIPPHNLGMEWMTWVWRGNAQTTRVLLDAPLPPERNERANLTPRPLTHLSGTNVWYRTERLPYDARLTYNFRITQTALDGRTHTSDVADALNPNPMFLGSSVAEGLVAPRQPWLKRFPGVAMGTLHRHSVFSATLRSERTFTVYTPAGSSARSGLVVLFDGEAYGGSDVHVPATLDNLIAKKLIEPVTVVFVNAQSADVRTDDYSCNSHFSQYIVHELVPWVKRKYNVHASATDTVIAGSSLGGLEAACTAFGHPDAIGGAIALSGSFFYYPGWPMFEEDPWTQTGWLAQQIAKTRQKPVRFFLTTGTFEGDGVYEVRRMRDTLVAKGYALTYEEYDAGHDRVVWRGAIADGLMALLGNGTFSCAPLNRFYAACRQFNARPVHTR